MKNSSYLFVYGTLLSGSKHSMSNFLRMNANFICKAWLKGKLYDLGTYPGLILAPEENSRVVGEIYELSDEEKIIRKLDEYEGSEYNRLKLKLNLENGEIINAWVYAYNGDFTDLKQIKNGDYLEFLAENN